MRTSRFREVSFSTIRSSLRRASSPSSFASSKRNSYSSHASSPADTLAAIMHRRPSMLELDEEKKIFPSGLEVLEPRPIVYWGGLEERMGALH